MNFSTPVVVASRTQTGRDEFGNAVYAESGVVVMGAFAPGSSTEVVVGEDLVVTQPTVYLPAGTVVRPTDVIVVNPQMNDGAVVLDTSGRVTGDRYAVNGQPTDWVSAFSTWAPGVEVKLLRATG